jgi:hypothetical protein
LSLPAVRGHFYFGMHRDRRSFEFEVRTLLYEPRKKTDPVHYPDVGATDVFHIDRGRVLNSEFLIHLAHFSSTGSGEELNFAYDEDRHKLLSLSERHRLHMR